MFVVGWKNAWTHYIEWVYEVAPLAWHASWRAEVFLPSSFRYSTWCMRPLIGIMPPCCDSQRCCQIISATLEILLLNVSLFSHLLCIDFVIACVQWWAAWMHASLLISRIRYITITYDYKFDSVIDNSYFPYHVRRDIAVHLIAWRLRTYVHKARNLSGAFLCENWLV